MKPETFEKVKQFIFANNKRKRILKSTTGYFGICEINGDYYDEYWHFDAMDNEQIKEMLELCKENEVTFKSFGAMIGV